MVHHLTILKSWENGVKFRVYLIQFQIFYIVKIAAKLLILKKLTDSKKSYVSSSKMQF